MTPVSNAVAESYFKDKTVTIVVPSGSGGTFHIYCQLVVRHLGRHIPDQPKLIIQNRPGAGGVKSLRYMTTVAPKDGSMIAMINLGTTMTPVLRPNIGYDTRDLQWLGAVSVRTYTLGVWHTVPGVRLPAQRYRISSTICSAPNSRSSMVTRVVVP
jgi:tripartite-type tricarboxylate transporter receptor subunit TctC